MPYSADLSTSSRKQKTSKGLKGKALSWQEDRVREPTECTKNGNPLYVSQHHERRQSVGEEPIFQQHSLMDNKKQWLESMVYKNEDIVKHGRNLPGYLQCEGKSKNTQGKTFNFGVLDWSRLENWKSNTKRIMKSSLSGNNLALESGSARLSTSVNNSIPQLDQQALNGSQLHSSCRERPATCERPKGKAIQVQSSETVHGLQTSCWKDLSSDSNGQQAEQLITSSRESSPNDTMRSHPSTIKMPSEENIDHDDDLHLSGHQDVMFSLGDSNASSSHEQWLSESREPLDHVLTELNPSFEVLQSFPFPLGTKPYPKCPVEIKDAPLKNRSLIENKSAVERLITDKDCKNVDQNSGEQPSVTGRHSSFSRRFNFSLEKMATSFSFRTSSAFPQLNSTYKSFGSSPDLHDYKSKKGNASNIVRSISMRLLDPLLKRKGPHSAKKVQHSNRNLISNEKTPIYDKQQKSSNVHALLQLTMKNGIPFFKLVVDSSSNILAAAVNKLPSGKDDSSLTYTFHSVHQIKKNGGWKNQSSTEKRCEFDYNIVGKMKISSSYHAEFSGLERDLFVVRESVLYGPDPAQSDQITPDCMLNAELATIIVKNTSSENYGGIGSSKSTVVILPGGIHSLPNSGKPSPLINRWRSGGACDCGGWDIGCELRVLTTQNESIKIPYPSSLDRLDLCYEGMHNNKHALSLAPLENGLYSLEYNASISLLQAFSICVAVVSCQNLTHIFQVNHLQDANDFSKPIMTRYEKVENRTIVHAKIPPDSPIGRV
ncbi:uncharacterized protein LOC112518173 isoform X1 [Cynara cardunculus var. scolymus]|uniref:uncharacterized protein LOC112518173 isoform X1 n=1 Tax=Cynara cardunculus var. scolymus TaxID=59895 RepID=UPI000D62DB76|nr:uncharacterized protein LOC112518173 isoform X1 [Cynara cardunculus var. scolymus]